MCGLAGYFTASTSTVTPIPTDTSTPTPTQTGTPTPTVTVTTTPKPTPTLTDWQIEKQELVRGFYDLLFLLKRNREFSPLVLTFFEHLREILEEGD